MADTSATLMCIGYCIISILPIASGLIKNTSNYSGSILDSDTYSTFGTSL